jgi:hypothetical protein
MVMAIFFLAALFVRLAGSDSLVLIDFVVVLLLSL